MTPPNLADSLLWVATAAADGAWWRPTSLEQLALDIQVITGILVLLGILVGYRRWWRPRVRKTTAEAVAVRDAILGREAVVDSITGEQLVPALPGIGVRTAKLEQAMEMLSVAVTKLTDQGVALAQVVTDMQEMKADVREMKRHATACDDRTARLDARLTRVEAVRFGPIPQHAPIPGDVPHE